jgi:tetratricopeptide (TPR) repeat protein
MPSENGRLKAPVSVSGIWIGNPDNDASWWIVPGTRRPAASELPSLIESLRASRPAWTADDSQFACVVAGPDPLPGQPPQSLLQVTRVQTRTPRTIYECDGQLADLAWSPDGTRLGFVERRSEKDAALRFFDETSGISEPINTSPVRKFAGFDRSGARYAYVIPDESGLPESSQQWALLLVPDRLARDKVIVARTRETAAETEVFTGMRVTFPVWSPTEDRLSLWITFVPRYQSLLSTLRRWGLLPGDPAATLDLATGEISWLAVTPAEELQVGHYYLLKKDYARAWEWYERANQKVPPREPPRNLQEFTQTLGAPERSQLFEYHCLKQLSRHDAAEARLREFEKNFFPVDPAAPGDTAASINDLGPIIMAEIVRQFGTEAPFLMRLIHDFYIAEAFLSVDAPEAGIAFFREQLQADDDDAQRLSREMALSQLLLIAGQYDEYLALCANFLKPLEVAARKSPADGNALPPADLNQSLRIYGSLLCLAPLFRQEFLPSVSEDALQETIEGWEARRSELDTMSNVAIDLFLRAAQQSLGNGEQVQLIEARLTKQGAGKIAFGEKSIDESVRDLFALPSAFGRLP